jgi:menaquinone-9 beta-reductase
VLAEAELRAGLAAEGGAAGVLEQAIAGLPAPTRPWTGVPATDDLRIALPLAHRVRRAAGSNFLLIGDASGFIDPLSGEGLQRAFASAAQAERAITRWLRGDQTALTDYDRHLRARFRSKDVLSWLLQAFLASPPLTAHALRSLERQPDLRRTLAMALADLAPASRALDPRFIGRLLLA